MRITEGSRLSRFIGDRAFYRHALGIVVPIIIQNTITNVVSLLDNVMVGQVGTLQMSAVAIVNQLLFVFNLCVFAGMSGAGIFSTQYVGAGDANGVRNCFRIKIVIGIFLLSAAGLIFTVFPETLIRSYLGEASPEELTETLGYSMDYLMTMLPGLIPFTVTFAYTSTIRENGETRMQMFASVISIFVNLVFNWLLIFGVEGVIAPLGVRGAAMATVLARVVEMCIVLACTYRNKAKYSFMTGALKTLKAPASLWKQVMPKTLPLLANESLWSTSLALILQCYSRRGIDVVAASNITSTVSNLFNVVFLSVGNAVAIMVGQALGAGEMDRAETTAWRLMTVSVTSSILMAAMLILTAPVIPNLYNTTAEIRGLACSMLTAHALFMPFDGISNNAYFTIRSGGRMFITFLFDCVFTMVFDLGCAAILAYLTEMPIVQMFFCVQTMRVLKAVIGILIVRQGGWKRRIIVKADA